MKVRNTIEGWETFARQALNTLPAGEDGVLEAELDIRELDSAQMSALQYSLLEFDRIEMLRQRQSEKRLIIHVSSTDDAYRILHYFWLITRTRKKLSLAVFANGEQVLEGGAALRDQEKGEQTGKEERGREERKEEKIPQGRIFPLLCVGRAVQNESVLPYEWFVLPQDPKLQRARLQKLFEEGKAPPVVRDEKAPAPILAYMEQYYMSILLRVFEKISGTGEAPMKQEEKEKVKEKLRVIVLEQMPGLGLLARMLWTLSLWALTLSKDLLHLNKDKSWSLDMETIYCSRFDAISYAEGLQQLVENAYLHSQMRRSYLTIRMHHTDITGTGAKTLRRTAQSRAVLQDRIQAIMAGKIKKKSDSSYALDPAVKYYFEFQVVNDSTGFLREGSAWKEYAPRGIGEMFANNVNLPWPPETRYRLREIFRGELLPEETRNDPAHLAQHYGLQVLEKTVRLNGGYFYVSSPGVDRRTRIQDRYQSFGKDLSRESPELRYGAEERYTAYLIFLPLIPHWHGTEHESSHQARDLLDREALGRSFRQKIIRLRIKDAEETGEDAFTFTLENCLQRPSEGETRQLNTENKMGKIRPLCTALEEMLREEDEETICLLDLMQARHYGLVELLAKMLFLFIAEEREKRPRLFALLFPGKEHIWEFIRIFSIFYDKLKDNDAMAKAQIALCAYREEKPGEEKPDEEIPEVAFLLAGSTSASARSTARIFAYYNAGTTMEMIPQIAYLTRGAVAQSTAVPQFPFDLFLTADAETPGGKSWFLRQMEGILNRELWKRPFGCRIRGIKVRLKSNIFLTDFYEAELLFHNIGIIYRFAYLIAGDILRQLRGMTPGERPSRLILVGYENYSTVLVEQIGALLVEDEAKAAGLKRVDYLTYSGQTEQTLRLSPALQSMEKTQREGLLKLAAYVSVVPIGTTLSTVYRIQNQVRAEMGAGAFPLDHYVLILVSSGENGEKPISDLYWKRAENLPGTVCLAPQEQNSTQTRARFFLEPTAEWKPSYEVDTTDPLREKVLVYVDQTSTIPKDIFIGEKSHFRGVSCFFGQKEADGAGREENERRAKLLKSCIYYGHLVTGNNHYQFYFDMDRYYARASAPCPDEGKNLRDWLQELRETVDADAYNIIVSPLHQEDSPFAKAVADQVFEHSLRFLHIDFSDTFREDVRAKFSYVAEEYAKIKSFDAEKTVNVYFVNTAITSGVTLQRARNLIMMLMEESGMAYDRGNVFKGCFVLINRSGYDTLNSYVDQPLKNFHAYVHLAVPSLNIRKNRCPTCELVRQYQRIEERCSSAQLREEFRRLAEKHRERDVSQFMKWQRDMVMIRSGYAGWLRQWLCAYVRGEEPDEKRDSFTVGIFQVDQQEFLRLVKLRRLMAWGLERFLAREGLDGPIPPDREEDLLKKLNSFSLRELSRLAESDHDGALASMGDEPDESCLDPEFWRHIVLDYVCGQKNYMRLMAIHNSFLTMEHMTEQMVGGPAAERADYTAECLLRRISDTLGETEGVELKVEWLISYLKVMSRPHLAQYHHIRQGILSILLRLVDDAVGEEENRQEECKREMAALFPYLRPDGVPLAPLLRYQLLQTVLKRLAGLQSIYLLQSEHQLGILNMIGKLRQQYFDQLRNGSSEEEAVFRARFQAFPPEEDIRIAMVKMVKWTSSCGDDENGCYLIEDEFGKEESPDGNRE